MTHRICTRRAPLSLAVVLLAVGLVGGVDDEPLRKEALRLNDAVGDDAIAQQIQTLGKQPEPTRALLRAAAAMAKQKEQPFNFNAALILGSAARDLKDLEQAEVFFKVCLDRAEQLKSDRKRLQPTLELLALRFENKQPDKAGELLKSLLQFKEFSQEGDDGDDNLDLFGRPLDAFQKDRKSTRLNSSH